MACNLLSETLLGWEPQVCPQEAKKCLVYTAYRLASTLVEHLTPDQEDMSSNGGTELGKLTKSGSPLGSGLLHYREPIACHRGTIYTHTRQGST